MRSIPSVVLDVTWERIYVVLTLQFQETIPNGTRFFLCDEKLVIHGEWKKESSKDTTVTIRLNVTNNGLNRCIQNGKYKIYASDRSTFFSVAGFAGKSETLNSWGRSFPYLNDKGVYSVVFGLDECSEQTEVQIHIINAERKQIDYYPIAETRNDDSKLKTWIIRNGIRFLYGISHFLFPRVKKTILMLSEQSDTVPKNMDMILRRMKERGLDSGFRILKSYRRFTSKPYSMISTAMMVFKLGAADIIIVDDHVPVLDWLVLNRNTTVIQVWHAGAGYKGVGYSRWGHQGCGGPFSAHRQNTWCVSGSKPIAGFFSEQFGVLDEQVIPTGMPRIDEFLNEEHRSSAIQLLEERIPQIIGRKVILFAPTYRGADRANAHYPYDVIDFDALYRLCQKKDAIVLFKMHPWVSEDVPIASRYSDRFICVNQYPNINDLFYISDLYITDYSSGIYEYSLLEKPMLFFAPDLEQFSSLRGFHRDYQSTIPGKLCGSFDDLLQAMEADDYEFEKVEEFIRQHFDCVDTNNSDRVIDWLILGELPEEFRSALKNRQDMIRDTIGTHLFENAIDS